MDIETGLQVVYEVILNIEIDQMRRTFLKHVLKISLLHKPKAGWLPCIANTEKVY